MAAFSNEKGFDRKNIVEAVAAALRHFGSLELEGGALAQARPNKSLKY